MEGRNDLKTKASQPITALGHTWVVKSTTKNLVPCSSINTAALLMSAAIDENVDFLFHPVSKRLCLKNLLCNLESR